MTVAYACSTIPTTVRSWYATDGRTGGHTWPLTFSPVAFKESIRAIALGERSIPLLLRHSPTDVAGSTAAGDFTVAEGANGLAITIWSPRALTYAKGAKSLYGTAQLSFGADILESVEQRDGGVYVVNAHLKEVTICPAGAFPNELRFHE